MLEPGTVWTLVCGWMSSLLLSHCNGSSIGPISTPVSHFQCPWTEIILGKADVPLFCCMYWIGNWPLLRLASTTLEGKWWNLPTFDHSSRDSLPLLVAFISLLRPLHRLSVEGGMNNRQPLLLPSFSPHCQVDRVAFRDVWPYEAMMAFKRPQGLTSTFSLEFEIQGDKSEW